MAPGFVQRTKGHNDSFKPNPFRYVNNMAGKACHVLASTTRVGLTQVLEPAESMSRSWPQGATAAVLQADRHVLTHQQGARFMHHAFGSNQGEGLGLWAVRDVRGQAGVVQRGLWGWGPARAAKSIGGF